MLTENLPELFLVQTPQRKHVVLKIVKKICFVDIEFQSFYLTTQQKIFIFSQYVNFQKKLADGWEYIFNTEC